MACAVPPCRSFDDVDQVAAPQSAVNNKLKRKDSILPSDTRASHCLSNCTAKCIILRPEESELLWLLVNEVPAEEKVDWDRLSQNVFPRFTANALRNHYMCSNNCKSWEERSFCAKTPLKTRKRVCDVAVPPSRSNSMLGQLHPEDKRDVPSRGARGARLHDSGRIAANVTACEEPGEAVSWAVRKGMHTCYEGCRVQHDVPVFGGLTLYGTILKCNAESDTCTVQLDGARSAVELEVPSRSTTLLSCATPSAASLLHPNTQGHGRHGHGHSQLHVDNAASRTPPSSVHETVPDARIGKEPPRSERSSSAHAPAPAAACLACFLASEALLAGSPLLEYFTAAHCRQVALHTLPTWTSVLLAEGTIVTLVGAPPREAEPGAKPHPRTLRVGARDNRTGLFQVSNITKEESEMFPLESYLMNLEPGVASTVIVKYSPCASREWVHLAKACQHGSGKHVICAWECTTAPAPSAQCLRIDEKAAVIAKMGLLLMPHEARKLALAESHLDRQRTAVVSPGNMNNAQEAGPKECNRQPSVVNEEDVGRGEEDGLGRLMARRAHCRKPTRTKRLSDAVGLQEDAAAVLPLFWGEKPALQGILEKEHTPQTPFVEVERQSHFSAESHALANSDSSTNEMQRRHLRRESTEESGLNHNLLLCEPSSAATPTNGSVLPPRPPTSKYPKVRTMRQVRGKVFRGNIGTAACGSKQLDQADRGTTEQPDQFQGSKFSMRDLNILSLRQLYQQPACISESNSVSDTARAAHTDKKGPLLSRPMVKRGEKRNAAACRNARVGVRERKPNRRYYA